MKNLDNYVQSLIPSPYTILGVQLRPFCLGHFFLMKRFECGFSSENPETVGGIPDLILALAICSRRFEEFVELITEKPKELLEWVGYWGEQVKPAIKDGSINMFEKLAMFKHYMRDSVSVPLFAENNDDSDAPLSGAHWTQSCLHILVSECGYNQTEALNIPLSRALADYYKVAEKNGNISFLSDDEVEMIEGSTKDTK